MAMSDLTIAAERGERMSGAADRLSLRQSMNAVALLLGHGDPFALSFADLRAWLEARGGSQRNNVVPAACADGVVPAATAGKSARSAEVANV